MNDNRFITSMSFRNGKKCEWIKDGNKFKLYINDGLDRRNITLEDLNNLPHESYIHRDGVFIKGNSDFSKWETRYFLVRGGVMTYFKDNRSSESQGTIPLENCVIELPNEERKSFVRLGRSGVNGYELKLTHFERRPFILVFSTAMERKEWKEYLTRYIAQTFVSNEYRLSEVIESVINGVFVRKSTGIIGTGDNDPDIYHNETEKFLYIDWYSSDPREWCLRCSSRELNLIPSLSGTPCEYEFDQTHDSDIITLDRISKVIENDVNQRSIKLHIYNGSSLHPNGIGEVWNLIPQQEQLISLWFHAIKSVLTLHETNIPTQIHRRSRVAINNLRAQLEAQNEPRRYTRVSFLREIYSIRHGNEFDLGGAGVRALAEEMTYPRLNNNNGNNDANNNNNDGRILNEENLPNPPPIEALQITENDNNQGLNP